MIRIIRNNKIWAVVTGLLFIFSACVKNELTVTLKLDPSVTDAYQFRYYASDSKKGWFMESSITVEGGVGKGKCYTKNPTIVTISHGVSGIEAGFYAERGDKIVISGNNSDPYSWKITGNKTTEAWSEWRLANKEILKGNESAKINAAVSTYVTKNPDKTLSTILLLLYYDRRFDEKGFDKLWGTLKGDALNPSLIKLIGRNDMLDARPLETEKVKELVVATKENGADTLRIGKKPLLLLFSRYDEEGYDDMIQEIRKLREVNKDSANYVMGEISFNLDSISWANRQYQDSLTGVVRGWLPRGESDSVMMRLGVQRTPYMLIYDKTGKEVYRSGDVNGGLNVYKKLLK